MCIVTPMYCENNELLCRLGFGCYQLGTHSPRRPPRPQPHVNSLPFAVTAAEWNLAAASATTLACRSKSSLMGSAANPVPPVPVDRKLFWHQFQSPM